MDHETGFAVGMITFHFITVEGSQEFFIAYVVDLVINCQWLIPWIHPHQLVQTTHIRPCQVSSLNINLPLIILITEEPLSSDIFMFEMLSQQIMLEFSILGNLGFVLEVFFRGGSEVEYLVRGTGSVTADLNN